MPRRVVLPRTSEELDHYERLILVELQKNARASIQELSERIGLSASPTWRRVKSPGHPGIIDSDVAMPDAEKLGFQAMHIGARPLGPARQGIDRGMREPRCSAARGAGILCHDRRRRLLAARHRARHQGLRGILAGDGSLQRTGGNRFAHLPFLRPPVSLLRSC